MRHAHIHLHYLDGQTAERCLQNNTWHVSEETLSVVIGVGLPRTHYPITTLRWFSLTEKHTDCEEN